MNTYKNIKKASEVTFFNTNQILKNLLLPILQNNDYLMIKVQTQQD